MPGKRSVSPAKYTRAGPASIRYPTATATGPRGSRLPECTAIVVVTVTPAWWTTSPGADLSDVVEPLAAHPGPRTLRYHDQRVVSQHPQRRQVEVVVVQVGDEHEIDLVVAPQVGGVRHPPQDGGPEPQHRVGHDASALDLDEDRGVPEIGQVVPVRHAPTLRK